MKNTDTPLVTLNGEALPGRLRAGDGGWMVRVRKGSGPFPSCTEVPPGPVVRYNIEQLEVIEAAYESVLVDYQKEEQT